MFKRDNVWLGALMGIVLPALAFFLVEILKRNIRIFQKDDLLYIACVAINLFLVKYYFRIDKENTARGIVGATFICALVFMFYKVRQ